MEIATALPKNRRNGRGWVACCPAHADKNPSLSIDESRDGKVLLHCHAGCEQEDVIDALRTRGLWPEHRPGENLHRAHGVGVKGVKKIDTPTNTLPVLPAPATSPPPDFAALLGTAPTDTWDYLDADGRVLGYTARVDRAGKKDVYPVTPNGTGAWQLKAFPEPRPLYGLAQLAERPDAPVLVVEGEKVAVAASKLFEDRVPITWSGGCAVVGKADWRPLKGRDVVIWPDADEPGIKAAREVADQALNAGAANVRVVVLPDGLPKGWDLADDIPEGMDVDGLVADAQVPVGAPPNLPLTDPSIFEGRAPDRRWLVQDWIPWGHVTMLSGDGGVGKSLLLQQLLTCAAIGQDWLGQGVTPVKTLGVFCEDDVDELHRRQDAINQLYGIEYKDLANMRWMCRLGMDNAMMIFPQRDSPGERTVLCQQVVNTTKEFGAHLIGLDALHDLFSGNENARPQARQFIHTLSFIAAEIDGAVLLTAHPSLSGLSSGSGTSGSTAWNNAVRSRLYLKKPKADDDGDVEDNDRMLKREKANYAGIGDEIRLTWANGVMNYHPEEMGVDAAAKASQASRVFTALIFDSIKNGVNLSASPLARNYAPKRFSILPADVRENLTKKDFDGAMRRSLRKGEIETVEYGPPSAPKRRLVIAEKG